MKIQIKKLKSKIINLKSKIKYIPNLFNINLININLLKIFKNYFCLIIFFYYLLIILYYFIIIFF